MYYLCDAQPNTDTFWEGEIMYQHDGVIDIFIADLKPEPQRAVLALFNVTFNDANWRDFLYGKPLCSVPEAWFAAKKEEEARRAEAESSQATSKDPRLQYRSPLPFDRGEDDV